MISKELNNLNHYMFFNKLIMNFISDKCDNTAKKVLEAESKSVHTDTNSFFTPTPKDKLFWCYYIIKNGFFKYELLDGKYFTEEQNNKIDLINDIRKQKDIIKSKKWKLKSLECSLSSEVIDISTFMCICFLSNINILIKKNNCIYYQNCISENKVHVIEFVNNSYSLNTSSDDSTCNKYLTNFYIVENINKPLRGITYYKINDLRRISIKLGIDIKNEKNIPFKKLQLYDMIKLKLN